MSIQFKFFTAIFVFCCSASCYADYLVTGPIEGNVCRGFGIQICGLKALDAVRGSDGQPHEILRNYDSVTEYNENSGRCTIKTKSSDLSIISWGINAIKQPVFLQRTDSGGWLELDVDYIRFKCIKRRL